ncbi:hypothetical protein BIFDEN_01241 [Bifidobacterium dentium ATCC 27678]|nr:hypothetical protein BIFDEN_01241 [Bifidobacterium dentium ATCC 27678]HBJ51778.1 hypothetical protein [Bifidobacterium dentium]
MFRCRSCFDAMARNGTPSSRFEGCGRRTHIQRVAVDKSMPPLLTVHKYVNYWDLMLLEIPLIFLTD